MTSEISTRAILVPLDVNSDHDRSRIFDLAEAEARMIGGRLVFLAVVPELYLATTTDPESLVAGMMDQAARRLEAAVAARWPDPESAPRLVRYGPVAGEIIDAAEETGAELIMIRARRPGVASYALGSVASRVVNHAGASVYVVRG